MRNRYLRRSTLLRCPTHTRTAYGPLQKPAKTLHYDRATPYAALRQPRRLGLENSKIPETEAASLEYFDRAPPGRFARAKNDAGLLSQVFHRSEEHTFEL